MSSIALNTLRTTLLCLFDVIAYFCSLFCAFYLRKILTLFFPQLTEQFPFIHFLRFWWVPLIFFTFFAYERLYEKRLPFWDETKEFVKAISVSVVTVLAIITLGKLDGTISRMTVVFLWGFGLLFFPILRLAGKKILYRSGLWKDNVIIIGAGSAAIATARGIMGDTHLGYHILGFLDDSLAGSDIGIDGTSYRIFGKIKHFRKFVRHMNVSTVIIAIPSLSVEKLSTLTNEIQKHTKSVLLVPDIKGVALTNTELHHLFMEQLFLLKINNNLRSPLNRAIKRLFEIALSVLLLPFLLPSIVMIAIFIKMDSRGPVFYIENRFGKNRGVFKCIKFRTMFLDNGRLLDTYLTAHPDAAREWETFKKLKRYDPRITRVGKVLRKLSLDELPQFFNVLKGEMSLVGPRPYLPREEKDMKCHIDTIQLTPPGITGLWQVSGRNKLSFDDRLRLEAWYVLNWSVWLDIVILFRTFRAVFEKNGAF